MTKGSFLHKVFAWQSGYTLKEDLQNYGLNAAYPTQLQPMILNAYRVPSLLYHDWAGINKDRDKLQKAIDSMPDSLEETMDPMASTLVKKEPDAADIIDLTDSIMPRSSIAAEANRAVSRKRMIPLQEAEDSGYSSGPQPMSSQENSFRPAKRAMETIPKPLPKRQKL